MTLADDDKLWIIQNLDSYEPKFQMTYMVGPINVTVRLNKIDEVVPAIEKLVGEARGNQSLNAKVEIPSPEKAAEEEASHPKAKCETCGADMKYAEGITKTGKNKGQPFTALFCPNAIKGNYELHKAVWL